MTKADSTGILLVITGGNVGLVAGADRKRDRSTVLRPATLDQIRLHVFGESGGESLLVREGNLSGTEVRVDLEDLRKRKRHVAADPESLDSAQVNPALWEKLARIIVERSEGYEGFVILHGLDTMAYTASALSFMLGELNRPVILAGSQRPLNFHRTDAVQNIRSAITLAAARSIGSLPVVQEVTVLSYDSLFRGSRATMVHSSSYRAFDSPNFPALGLVGEQLEIQTHLLRRPPRGRRIVLRKSVTAKVSILDVFPGIDPGFIGHLASDKTIKGVLLRTYGMGTAPTSPELLAALQSLVDAGKVVMNVTQARGGRISHGQDAVSLRLAEQGVISGVDMTAEAAYAKMVVLLSEHKRNLAEAQDRLQIAYCGEQSQSIFHFHFGQSQTEADEDGTFRAFLDKSYEMVERHLLGGSEDAVTYAQLRLLGVEPVERTEKRVNRAIDFDAYLIDQNASEDETVAHLRDEVLRWYATGSATINIAYNITQNVSHLLNPDTRLRIDTTEAIRWKRCEIAIYATVEL